METDVTMDLLQLHNNLNRNITMDTAVWYMSERFLGAVVRESLKRSVVIRSATDWREEQVSLYGGRWRHSIIGASAG
jgi:hypothetical protein